MLTVPLRTPLTRLPAEYHVEAVGIFKLVRVCTDHLPNHSPSPKARQETPVLLPWTIHQPSPEPLEEGLLGGSVCPPLWGRVWGRGPVFSQSSWQHGCLPASLELPE